MPELEDEEVPGCLIDCDEVELHRADGDGRAWIELVERQEVLEGKHSSSKLSYHGILAFSIPYPFPWLTLTTILDQYFIGLSNLNFMTS